VAALAGWVGRGAEVRCSPHEMHANEDSESSSKLLNIVVELRVELEEDGLPRAREERSVSEGGRAGAAAEKLSRIP